MKKLFLSSIAMLFLMGSITACTNKDLGMTAGAAVGGIAGSALTGGSTAGTIVGAVGGGFVGRSLAN